MVRRLFIWLLLLPFIRSTETGLKLTDGKLDLKDLRKAVEKSGTAPESDTTKFSVSYTPKGPNYILHELTFTTPTDENTKLKTIVDTDCSNGKQDVWNNDPAKIVKKLSLYTFTSLTTENPKTVEKQAVIIEEHRDVHHLQGLLLIEFVGSNQGDVTTESKSFGNLTYPNQWEEINKEGYDKVVKLIEFSDKNLIQSGNLKLDQLPDVQGINFQVFLDGIHVRFSNYPLSTIINVEDKKKSDKIKNFTDGNEDKVAKEIVAPIVKLTLTKVKGDEALKIGEASEKNVTALLFVALNKNNVVGNTKKCETKFFAKKGENWTVIDEQEYKKAKEELEAKEKAKNQNAQQQSQKEESITRIFKSHIDEKLKEQTPNKPDDPKAPQPHKQPQPASTTTTSSDPQAGTSQVSTTEPAGTTAQTGPTPVASETSGGSPTDVPNSSPKTQETVTEPSTTPAQVPETPSVSPAVKQEVEELIDFDKEYFQQEGKKDSEDQISPKASQSSGPEADEEACCQKKAESPETPVEPETPKESEASDASEDPEKKDEEEDEETKSKKKKRTFIIVGCVAAGVVIALAAYVIFKKCW